MRSDGGQILVQSGSKVQYGNSWMRKILQSRQACDHSTENSRKELRMYLESPLENVENVMAWWGVRFCVLWCYMNSFVIVATFCAVPNAFSHGA